LESARATTRIWRQPGALAASLVVVSHQRVANVGVHFALGHRQPSVPVTSAKRSWDDPDRRLEASEVTIDSGARNRGLAIR
jgi:hypothetical protein